MFCDTIFISAGRGLSESVSAVRGDLLNALEVGSIETLSAYILSFYRTHLKGIQKVPSHCGYRFRQTPNSQPTGMSGASPVLAVNALHEVKEGLLQALDAGSGLVRVASHSHACGKR